MPLDSTYLSQLDRHGHFIQSAPRTKDAPLSPGPGDYNVNASQTQKRSPAFTLTRAQRLKIASSETPGPGQYDI